MKKQGTRFRFLGLNAADTPEGGPAFVKRFGWTWPSLRDPNRTLARRYGIDYQPAFVLIDAKGRVAAGFEGGGSAARWNALAAKLNP